MLIHFLALDPGRLLQEQFNANAKSADFVTWEDWKASLRNLLGSFKASNLPQLCDMLVKAECAGSVELWNAISQSGLTDGEIWASVMFPKRSSKGITTYRSLWTTAWAFEYKAMVRYFLIAAT